MSDDPHQTLRRWLPHILLMVVLGCFCWLLVLVFSPLMEPLLLAAALAVLTTPLLYTPIARVLRRVPYVPDRARRQFAGIIATVILCLIMILPVVLVIGSVGETVMIIRGVLSGDQAQLSHLSDLLAKEVTRIDTLLPALRLGEAQIPERVVDTLAASKSAGTTMLSYFFAGVGEVAQLVLSLVFLAFFYAEGPRLARSLLSYSPLDGAQQENLIRRQRQIVLRLLHDTIGVALVKGTVLGAIIWIADQTMGTGALPFVPIALLTAVLTLLPVVGVTMVWLPLASLLYSQGYLWASLTIGTGCVSVNLFLEWLRQRVGARIDERGAWVGFLLFLGLLGGLLAFGLKGLVIGPASVVLVSTFGAFWLPLYGVGAAPSTERLASLDEESAEEVKVAPGLDADG